MKDKKLEVKNVKHSDFASHETLCFQCTVYFDGVKVATADNEGRGGQTFVHFDDRETEKKVRAWEKEQPKIVSEYKSNKDDDEFFSYPFFSLESAIDPLVSDFLTERDLKRKLKTKLLITDDTCGSGQFYTWTLKVFGQRPIEDIANAVVAGNKFENPVVLNMLPFDEALKHWENNDA